MMCLERRLDVLESALGQFCPRGVTSEAMSEAMGVEEFDARIQPLLSGQATSDLPEPSPSCPHCQKLAAMSEAEVDAELAMLWDILRKAI